MSDDNSVSLYRCIHDCVPLDALLKLPKRTVTGLFYSPGFCAFGVVDPSGEVIGAEGALALESVFEARLFDAHGEWRWLRDPADAEGKGRGIGLSEQPSDGDWQSVAVRAKLDQHYLLWGEPLPEQFALEDISPGWQWVSSARIGRLGIPGMPMLRKGQRFRLQSLEYLGLAPGEAGERHGNVVVLEERLVGIETYPEEVNHA